MDVTAAAKTSFLFVISLAQISATYRNKVFQQVTTDKALDIVPFLNYQACTLGTCSLNCLSEARCLSYNYNFKDELCELLDVDRNTKSDEQMFEDRTDWSYFDTGFNMRNPSWRNKYVDVVKCPANHCGRCECIQPMEEKRHYCNCYSAEDQVYVKDMCWKIDRSQFDADEAHVTLTDECSSETNIIERLFRYYGETGDLRHAYTGKRVCPKNESLIGTEIVVSDTCPNITIERKWMFTESNTLHYVNKCVHVSGSMQVGKKIGLSADCFNETFSFRHFSRRGRVLVKFWDIDVPSIADFTLHHKFPDEPLYTAWFYNFDTPSYEKDFFGRLITAVFVSPESGDHIFSVNADDMAELYFGIYGNEEKLIYNTASHTYGRYVFSKKTAPINLNAGTKYNIRAVYLERKFFDYFSVGVTFPSGKTANPITDGYFQPINEN